MVAFELNRIIKLHVFEILLFAMLSLSSCMFYIFIVGHSWVAFLLSVLAGRKELLLASLNERSKVHGYVLSRHNSLNSHALADRSGRTERLRSMSTAIAFWSEPVLRVRAYNLRTDLSDLPDRTNYKRPQIDALGLTAGFFYIREKLSFSHNFAYRFASSNPRMFAVLAENVRRCPDRAWVRECFPDEVQQRQ